MKFSDQLYDDDRCIRADATDLNAIIDNIDAAEGRNDALRGYIPRCATCNMRTTRPDLPMSSIRRIQPAQDAIERAFCRLMLAQFALNQS